LATLIVLQGPDKGKTLTAEDDCVAIGRDADVTLNDQTISRRHAELRRVDGEWVLRDLNSVNGTYVNGVRIDKPVRLRRGDQIRLGNSLLVYTGDEPPQPKTVSVPGGLVTLDAGSVGVDSSLVASVPARDDSLVRTGAGPENTYALKAWNVMRELSEVIGSLLPVRQLLERVMDIIFEQVEVDRGVILLRGTDSEELRPEVVRWKRPPEPGPEREKNLLVSRSLVHHVIQSREGVLCSNIVADQRFSSGKSVQNIGMRSVICAPLLARDQVVGVIHLDCPVTRHTYNEYELKLVTAIAYQAGLAVENVRLVQSHLERERLAAAGETVAYLSHYIKNILQGLRSGADLLQSGLDRRDLTRAAAGWRIVERNLDRTYNLVLNMLAFSKQREPNLEDLQVNEIVNDVVSLVQKQADEAGAVLLTDLEEKLPLVAADRDGLHQVVLNLLTNAIDAVQGRKNGIISVRTTLDADGQSVVICVTDNGPGVPPEQRAKLFEPFHSTKGHGGTGLGLAAAKKIVRELHGSLELVDPPDGGAQFRVRLPLRQPESAAESSPTQRP